MSELDTRSFGLKALGGVSWTGASTILGTGLQLAVLAILSRLIEPAEFGLFGIVLVVVGFAQIFADTGLSAAIVQRQDPTREQLSSLYWLNIGGGSIIALVVAIAGPIAAAVLDEPDLTPLMLLASLTFVVTPFGLQFQSLLQRDLNFKRIATNEMAGAIASAIVAVSAALAGAGVYALVFGQLANVAARTLLLSQYGWTHYRPSLHFARRDLQGYLSFGMFQMADRIVAYFGTRMDQFVIVAMLGVETFGFYVVATNFSINLVDRIKPVILRVIFPVWASMQTSEVRLGESYVLITRVLAVLITPIFLGIASTAPQMVSVIFGEQWEPASEALRYLAIASLLRGIHPLYMMLIARGRADLGFAWASFDLIASVPLAILGAELAGLEGVAFSVVVVEALHQVIATVGTPRLTLVSSWTYLFEIARPVTFGLAMAVVVILIPSFMEQGSEGAVLAAQVGTGGLVYVGLLALNRASLQRPYRLAGAATS